MGSQTEHSEASHQDSHNSHASTQPFTEHELILIEMANKHAGFEGHHHHSHHHSNVQYRRPFNIDTNLGLFALRKLNAINPEFLTQSDKKLLQPIAPGAVTHLIYGGLIAATGWYSYYAWRNAGFSFLIKPKTVVPLVGLVGSALVFQVVGNYLREGHWAYARSKLVESYKQKFGQKFLLDVLEPNFRLPEANDGK